MKICQAGQICDGFQVLSNPWTPVFLLEGEQPVLWEGGFACLAGMYLDHMAQILGEQAPAWCLVTHVHFDHCGAVGHFHKRYPELRVACSALGRDIISRPNAVKLIEFLSEEAKKEVRERWPNGLSQEGFLEFPVHRTLVDGDRIEGPTPIEALATPGHTRDSMSYWLPERGILIVGEAMGIMDDTGYVVADLLQDAGDYLQSFETLAALQPEVLALGHRYVFTGSDVPAYIERSRDDTHAFIEKCGQAYDRLDKNPQAVVDQVRSWEYDPKPHPKQPEAAYLINLAARVKASLRHLGKLEN